MTCDFTATSSVFQSYQPLSGRWEVDNERLCAMELCLQLRTGNKLEGDVGDIGSNFSLFSAEGEVSMYMYRT